MSTTLDYALVLAAVLLATAYLLWRRFRSARSIARDWSSGHVDACDACPAIKIRKAQQKKLAADKKP